MANKIYAALEIADQEIRVVVAEEYNSRFNIIKIERYKTIYKIANKIIDEDALSADVKQAVLNCSKAIKAPIQAVILLLPSQKFKRIPAKVSVEINQFVTSDDIKTAFDKAYNVKTDDKLVVIDVMPKEFSIGSNIYDSAPLNKKASVLWCKMNCLAISRDVAYEYARIIEKANLRVMDVILDNLALTTEINILGNARNKNVIIINVEDNFTSLSLLANSSLLSTELISPGLNKLYSALRSEYNIKEEACKKLVMYNSSFENDNVSNDPIYVWDYGDVTHSISLKDLMNTIKVPLESVVEEIKDMCQAIIESNTTEIVLAGSGAEINGIEFVFEDIINVAVSKYTPSTLGARSGDLSAILGSLLVYKDYDRFYDKQDVSVDLDIYQDSLETSRSQEVNVSFTNRLKKILVDSKREVEVNE